MSIDLPYLQSNLANFYFHSNVVGKSPIKGAKQRDNQTKWISFWGLFQSRCYQRMFRRKLLANANRPDKGRYEQKYGATLRTPTLRKLASDERCDSVGLIYWIGLRMIEMLQNLFVYPLVNNHITMENHHAIHGKTHYKWPCSIAFCMFTRPGSSLGSWVSLLLSPRPGVHHPAVAGWCRTPIRRRDMWEKCGRQRARYCSVPSGNLR